MADVFGRMADVTGDGIADLGGFDQDGNGWIDTYQVDSNGDGAVDQLAYDLNEDGYIDHVEGDTNFDGYMDTAGADEDENGLIETGFYDYNQDGAWDTVADSNENGVADVSEVQVYQEVGVVGPATNPNPLLDPIFYQDPGTAAAVGHILDIQNDIVTTWTLPDNMELVYEDDSY